MNSNPAHSLLNLSGNYRRMKYMHTYKEDMPNEPDKWHWQERGTADLYWMSF
jgi:hypothetical protein